MSDTDEPAPPELPPLDLAPMHPLDGPPPPPGDHRWVYQVAVPGEHVVVHVNGALSGLGILPPVRIVNSLGRDLSDLFPELDALVDLGDEGPISMHGVLRPVGDRSAHSSDRSARHHESRGHDLAYRLAATDRADARARALPAPVELVVLDLMHLDGRRVADQPYAARRFLLAARVPAGPSWTIPVDHLDPGPALLAGSEDRCTAPQLLSRRLDSRYFPGMTSRAWLSTPYRILRRTRIVGWVDDHPGDQSHTDAILVAGAAGRDGRRPVQAVRHGLTMSLRAKLSDELTELPATGVPEGLVLDEAQRRASPRTRHWVRPGVTATLVGTSQTVDRLVSHPVLLDVHSAQDWSQLREPRTDAGDTDEPSSARLP